MAYKYIELFAGCGGLSLGLESSGFELELANELSPMAAETFAYNLLGLDKSHILEPRDGLACDVAEITNLNPKDWAKKKLVIGDVINFVETLSKNPKLTERFMNIDLVSGGPPCQGFSMAGRRKERVSKNALPYAFVDLVDLIRPKIVLLENVEGITRPFKSDGGTKRPWLEIAKAFASIGYAPICFLLNTKYFGIPQNRPRFILIGIDAEYGAALAKNMPMSAWNNFYKYYDPAIKLAKKPIGYIEKFDGNDQKEGIHINLIQIEKIKSEIKKGKVVRDLHKVFNHKNLFPEVDKSENTVKDAIDDLAKTGIFSKANGNYPAQRPEGTELSKLYSKLLGKVIKHPINNNDALYNHELRKHGVNVEFRFSLIQEVFDLDSVHKETLTLFMKGKLANQNRIKKLWLHLKTRKEFTQRYSLVSYNNFLERLQGIKSKKHTQRVLDPEKPAPAQVTIPDDLCHYDKGEPRVLTVREMARIQSFPDDFIFRSKVTTGGKLRSSETPQYTQVGNAVPPVLGRELGQFIGAILDYIK